MLLVIYGKKSELLIYSGTELPLDMLYYLELNLPYHKETKLPMIDICQLLKMLKELFKETGIMNSLWNLLLDKLMPLLLLDSTMDMLMMISLVLLILKLLKLLLYITTISVANTKLIKMMMLLKSQVLCMEDINMIHMEEVTLGFYLLEDLLIFFIEVLYMLKLKEANSI